MAAVGDRRHAAQHRRQLSALPSSPPPPAPAQSRASPPQAQQQKPIPQPAESPVASTPQRSGTAASGACARPSSPAHTVATTVPEAHGQCHLEAPSTGAGVLAREAACTAHQGNVDEVSSRTVWQQLQEVHALMQRQPPVRRLRSYGERGDLLC